MSAVSADKEVWGRGEEDANRGRETDGEREKWRRVLKSLFVSRDELKQGASWLVGQRLSLEKKEREKKRCAESQGGQKKVVVVGGGLLRLKHRQMSG